MKQKMFGMLTAAVIAASCCQPVSAAETPEQNTAGDAPPALSYEEADQNADVPDAGIPQQHQNNDYTWDRNGTGLKDRFGPYFRIGASINRFTAQNPSYQQFYQKHFNSVTCENEMKPDQIIKSIDGTDVTVDLTAPAPVLKFAEENGIGVRGMTFVWYSQTPNDMFRGTPEECDQRIENFIRETFTQIKTNYPDLKLYAYDVVNEPFKNDGGGLRVKSGSPNDCSRWAKVYGDDNDSFIINAFRAARTYAPEDCKLFLNEYNEYMPEKCDDICELAKRIMAAGDYIDGIGMQSHVSSDYPEKKDYEDAVKKFAALGLDIQITELDVTKGRKDSAELYRQQWKDVFNVACNYANHISGVTMWDPCCNYGSRPTFQTLFDRNMQPNAAYYDVVNPTPDIPTPGTTTEASPVFDMCGDANCDGAVDIADAVLIMRYAVEDREAVITDQGRLNSDTDGDGKVSSEDAKRLLLYIAKKIGIL